MRETLEEILSLHLAYSPENTPLMDERGKLIRRALPTAISQDRELIASALGRFGEDLRITGRDGTGLKALVPWARIHSRRMSPKPQSGWYVVYLFHPDASGVSVCLSHGSTRAVDGGFREHRKDEVDALMAWAREALRDAVVDDPGISSGVVLGKAKLAAAYEKTTVRSKFYARGQVPSEDVLRTDLLKFTAWLERLYTQEEISHRVTIAGSPEDLDYPLAESATGGLEDPSSMADIVDARTRIETAIFVRRGSKVFRGKVLRGFKHTCAVTGSQARAVLEAAHIVPHKGAHTDTLDNALLLRADVHTLFDCQLLWIDPESLTVSLASELAETEYSEFAGQRVDPADGVSPDTLRLRLKERAAALAKTART